jgi:tRNA dimethylallyltransferase
MTNTQIHGFCYKNREDLEKNIRQRVLKRLEQGAISEVEELLKRGYTKTDPGLQTIGYKEILGFLDGTLAKEQMIEQWIISEVQYAKRQYTFMKKDENIRWNIV